jgi:hypothetical protein
MLVIDLRCTETTDTYTKSGPNVILIKRDGIVFDLPQGFLKLPAESAVQLRGPERYPKLQACLPELQGLFAPPASRILTYLKHFRQGKFGPSEANVRTRIILIIYSMWMVPGWLTDSVCDELIILSYLLSHAISAKFTPLEIFATYIKGMNDYERQALADVLGNVHLSAMEGHHDLHHTISADQSYLDFCMAGEENIRKTLKQIAQLNAERQITKIFRDFVKLHNVFSLWGLEKEGKYNDCAEWCSQYIDGALSLINEYGCMQSSQLQLAYFYDRISVALMKSNDEKAAYDRLTQMFSLPKALLGHRPTSAREVLVERFKRLDKKFNQSRKK